MAASRSAVSRALPRFRPARHNWNAALGSPRWIAAPLVDMSERAWRLLVREHGVEAAYTPMLNARLMVNEPSYVPRHFDPHPDEPGPLVAQLAGSDPETMVAAARICVDGGADAIDINFGCPQDIARSGRYGAFLLEDEPQIALACVRALRSRSAALAVPVTAKLRLQKSQRATVEMALRLQDAGASALCLHARTRHQIRKLQGVGAADWDSLREIADALEIPLIANGGIATHADLQRCRDATGAAAVMIGEALLENPALCVGNRHFDPAKSSTPTEEAGGGGGSASDGSEGGFDDGGGRGGGGATLDQDAMATRYLELCADHPPPKGISQVKSHLRCMLHSGWQQWPDLADELYVSTTREEVAMVVRRLRKRGWSQPHFHTCHERPELSWYARHRTAEEGQQQQQRHHQGQGQGQGGQVAAVAPPDGGRGGDAESHAAWCRRYLGRSSAKRHGRARKLLRRSMLSSTPTP